MNRLDYQGGYNPPNASDWMASNSAALVEESPYGSRPLLWPAPAPTSRDLSATTRPQLEISGDTMLRQVLLEFGVELRSPMPDEVVARIEEETPEVPAKYDLATYEYRYLRESNEDAV